jgi:hypothetical protein
MYDLVKRPNDDTPETVEEASQYDKTRDFTPTSSPQKISVFYAGSMTRIDGRYRAGTEPARQEQLRSSYNQITTITTATHSGIISDAYRKEPEFGTVREKSQRGAQI